MPVRIDMMRGIFSHIEAHLKDRIEPLSYYQDKCVRYYEKHINTYPNLNFILARKNGFQVLLRIEVDWKLFYGVIFAADDDQWSRIPAKEVMDAFPGEAWKRMIEAHKRDWWLWWRYLPDYENLLNFRDYSGAYPELYEPEGYRRITEAIYRELDENLESIIRTGLPVDAERVE